jgi:hypothetical protein
MPITPIEKILKNPNAYYKIPKNKNNEDGKTIQCVAYSINYPYNDGDIYHYDIENGTMVYDEDAMKFKYSAPKRSNANSAPVLVSNNINNKLDIITSKNNSSPYNLDFIAMDLKNDTQNNNQTLTYNLDLNLNNTRQGLQGFRLIKKQKYNIEIISLKIDGDGITFGSVIDDNDSSKLKSEPYYPKELFKISEDGQYIKISCQLLYWVLNYVLFLPIETGDNITYAILNHSKNPNLADTRLYASVKPHVRMGPPQGPPPKFPPPLPPRLTPKSHPLSTELDIADSQTGGLRHKSKRTKKNTKRS